MADDVTPKIEPSPIPAGRRRAIMASTRLLHEWAALQNWDATPSYEERLGPTPLIPGVTAPSVAMAAMLKRGNRYADLIGPINGEILVVEAKIILSPDAIGQLIAYIPLVAAAPIAAKYPGRRVAGLILCAVDDAHVHALAVKQGLNVEIFAPPWVGEYLAIKWGVIPNPTG